MSGIRLLAFMILLLIPAALPGQAVPATPGKVTKQYQDGDVGFKYPENWTIIDRRGPGVMIGSATCDSMLRYKNGYKIEPVTVPTHGLLFGSYDGNAVTLEDAADELLGVLEQRLPYLKYRDDAKGRGKVVGDRDFFWIGITHEGITSDLQRTYTTGVLFVTNYKGLTWYWLFFHPRSDAREYVPLTKAIMRSLMISAPEGLSTGESGGEPGGLPAASRSTELSGREVAKKCSRSLVTLITRDAKGHPLRVEEIPTGGRFSLAVSAVSSFVPV